MIINEPPRIPKTIPTISEFFNPLFNGCVVVVAIVDVNVVVEMSKNIH